MAEQIEEWFIALLDELEQENKADIAGLILARMNDEYWWSFWNERLAALIFEMMTRSGHIGAKVAARQLRMEIDWQIISPDVVAWAREHAGALVTQMSDDLRERIRAEIVQTVSEGRSWREARERIEESGLPRWRAERIARTEIIRAHSRGAVAGYESTGTVRGLKWLDGQNGACELCRALHGKAVRVGEKFYDDPRFGDGLPPRHPHCRCAIKPITLDQVKRLPKDHPLRDDWRNSVAELTDRDTYTEIAGVRVTGERRRHWRLRHARQFDVARAEKKLQELLLAPMMIKRRGGPVYVTEWNERNYLIAPIDRDGNLLSLYIKTKRKVDKWPDW